MMRPRGDWAMVQPLRDPLAAMPETTPIIDPTAIEAAARALGEELRLEAQEQHAYLHRFPDGKVSLELKWVDPAALARAVVVAYLAALRAKQTQ